MTSGIINLFILIVKCFDFKITLYFINHCQFVIFIMNDKNDEKIYIIHLKYTI